MNDRLKSEADLNNYKEETKKQVDSLILSYSASIILMNFTNKTGCWTLGRLIK